MTNYNMDSQTVVYEEGNVFEAAVAIMCKDANIVLDVVAAPPREDSNHNADPNHDPSHTLVVFIETVADLECYYGKGFKVIRAISYTDIEDEFEAATGEAVAVFPPNKIFTKLALEPGIEVASFLDNVIMKVFAGKYTPAIGDTTAAGASRLFKAIGGQRMRLADACIEIIDCTATTADFIAQGATVERVRRANLFRALQAGIPMMRSVPLCPGDGELVHPDGAAAEKYAAKILHINYSDDIMAELDYVVEFMKDSKFDYVMAVGLMPSAPKGDSGNAFVFRSLCLRLNSAAPAGMCVVGGGEEKNQVTVFDSEKCPFAYMCARG